MRYDGLLNNRRDFIKLSEYAVEVAQNTKDWQLLEFANVAMMFRYMLSNYVALLDMIALVHSNWARQINYEVESYTAWNDIQEQHIKAYRANAEYEYDFACQCHILKNTPKTQYHTKH